MMDLTCKQLVIMQTEALWDMFWLAVAVHVALGLLLPAIRFVFNYFRIYLKQNLQDHAELGQIIKHR